MATSRYADLKAQGLTAQEAAAVMRDESIQRSADAARRTAETRKAQAEANELLAGDGDTSGENLAGRLSYLRTFGCDIHDITGKNLPKLPPSIIDGMLSEGELITIIGPSKAGKSFFSMHVACCVAAGLRFLEHECHRTPVVYINLEISGAFFAHRLNPYADNVPRGLMKVFNLRGEEVTGEELSELAARELDQMGADGGGLLVVDCAYQLTGVSGSENDDKYWRELLAPLERFVSNGKRSCILVHHTRKGSVEQYSVVDRGSGSGVLGRKVDGTIVLSRLEADEGSEAARYMEEKEARAVRVEFGLRNRDEAKLPPVNCFVVGGEFKPDTAGILDALVGNGTAGGRRAAKFDEKRGRKIDLMRQCIEAVLMLGQPATRENVRTKYNELAPARGLETVTKITFERWTQGDSPIPFRLQVTKPGKPGELVEVELA